MAPCTSYVLIWINFCWASESVSKQTMNNSTRLLIFGKSYNLYRPNFCLDSCTGAWQQSSISKQKAGEKNQVILRDALDFQEPCVPENNQLRDRDLLSKILAVWTLGKSLNFDKPRFLHH